MATSPDRGGRSISSGDTVDDPYENMSPLGPAEPKLTRTDVVDTSDPDDHDDDDDVPPPDDSGEGFQDGDESQKDGDADSGDVTDKTQSAGKKPAKTEAKDDKSATSEDAIPDELYREAAAKGVSRSDAESFGSKRALEHYLLQADKLAMEWGKNSRTQNKGEGQTAAQPQGQQRQTHTQPAAQQQAPAKSASPISEMLQKINPETVADPEFVEVLRKADEHYQSALSGYEAKISGLETALNRVVSFLQDRVNAEEYGEFDSYIEGLPDWKETFGSGPTLEMDANSEHRKNRARLEEAVADIRTGYMQRTGKPMPVKRAVASAHRIVFEKEFNERVARDTTKQVTQSLRNRQGQFTNRPQGKRDRSNSRMSEREGVNKVGEILSEMGIK